MINKEVIKTKTFVNLDIWQLGITLAQKIYQITGETRLAKDYSFKDQLRRSALSISSNIAEGFEFKSNKMFIRHLYSKRVNS